MIDDFLLINFFVCLNYVKFHRYIYPPDWQESVGGATHRLVITPICFQKYQDIAVRLEFFILFFFGFIKI